MIGLGRNIAVDHLHPRSRPLTRVDLHVHLDGAVRHETIWDLAKERGVPLPGRGTLQELQDQLISKVPETLSSYIARLSICVDVLKGNLKGLERIAFEFVEDSALTGVIYSEVRFAPHLYVPEEDLKDEEKAKKWVWKIGEALVKGVKRGEEEFKTKVNLITCCLQGTPEFWLRQTLELTADINFHGGRIAGIDICATPTTTDEKFGREPVVVEVFNKAKELGLRRTIHAGEAGPARQVEFALDTLHAERIGHGYRLVEDKGLYQRMIREQIHVECCPWSSLLTGSVDPKNIPHPMVDFFRDGFNVSVGTDNPTVTGTHLDEEYELLKKWGLCEAHFVKGNFNAIRSSFLSEQEKKEFLHRMGKACGFVV